MYMIGHLTYGTLNTGDMVWTFFGQNRLLLLYDWSCPLFPLKGQCRDGTPVPSASGQHSTLPFVEADGAGVPSLQLLQLLSYRTALET